MNGKSLIALLVAIAAASRVVGSFVLPNAEQDGFSYAEIIGRLTRQFEAGQFHISDLYGFWLPLFQVATAILNIPIHDPIIAGKIVNVVCAVITLLLVFDIARRLTGNLWLSLGAFLIVLVDPLHILNSAACLTDIPHSCVVLASLWCAMGRKWLAAAVFGALAECIRIESWALVLALPLLQWICERRVSLAALAILLVPPLGWLGVTYAATGDPLTYFHERARYHVEYMRAHPDRRGFNRNVLAGDATYFLLGASQTVSVGAIAAAIIMIWRWIRLGKPANCVLLGPILYDAAMLGLIVLAYVTKAQPVLLPRYGLVFFVIGVPLLAWALQWCLARTKRSFLKVAIVVAVIGCFLLDTKKQLPTLWKARQDFRAHQQIAGVLATALKQSPKTRCFSDDVAIRVLSNVAPERFLRSSFVPGVAAGDADNFLAYLRSEQADYLIFFPTEDSIPVKLFPELSRHDQPTTGSFELVSLAPSSFGPDIWLYRIR